MSTENTPEDAGPRGAVYLDDEAMARIEASIRRGASIPRAFAVAGASKCLFEAWEVRSEKPGAHPKMVEAVNRLRRAREEAAEAAEIRVYEGGPDHRGALAWLERMDRPTWGKHIEISDHRKDGRADVDAFRAAIADRQTEPDPAG